MHRVSCLFVCVCGVFCFVSFWFVISIKNVDFLIPSSCSGNVITAVVRRSRMNLGGNTDSSLMFSLNCVNVIFQRFFMASCFFLVVFFFLSEHLVGTLTLPPFREQTMMWKLLLMLKWGQDPKTDVDILVSPVSSSYSVGGGFDSVIYSANLDGSFLSPAVSVAESCLLSCCPRHHDSTRGCDFSEPNEQIELHRRWIFIIRAAFVASICHLIISSLLLKSWILTLRDATKA